MATSVIWTTFGNPSTLVNVGSEALCLAFDNILCFRHLKTNAITYYKAEGPETGLSVKSVTGHNKFALVAFSEIVIRPSVHIIQYPKFTKYAVFKTEKIITFSDVRFNDYDLLLALSGRPFYTICIWNFRSGQLLLQHDTCVESIHFICSARYSSQIAQFSEWHNEIHLWEVSYSAKGRGLHEVSRIKLPQEFSFSDISSMCYGEDDNLYVVDNLARVYMVMVAQFYLKPKWSAHGFANAADSENLKCFHIISHKQGLLVCNDEVVYYLRCRQNVWQCEWQLVEPALPKGLIKYLSNTNGEIYAVAELGHLYHIEVSNNVANVNAINTMNENALDCVVIKGVKEECILQLTVSNHINAFSMTRYFRYSSLEIPHAKCMVAHNVAPFVIVGTSTGQLYFINYSIVKEPVIVASLENEKGHPIDSLAFLDRKAVYHTTHNDLYLIKADFAQNVFFEIGQFANFEHTVSVREIFFGETNRMFIFISRDTSILVPHVQVMCLCNWVRARKGFEFLEFNLPVTYRCVTCLAVPMKNVVEFFAVRFNTSIVDYLNYRTDAEELVVMHSIQTNHLANINGITGSANILTWGVDGTYIHYRSHRKSSVPYGISQLLQIRYRAKVVKKIFECLMIKFLVCVYSKGGCKVMRISTTGLQTIVNNFIHDPQVVVDSSSYAFRKVQKEKEEVIVHTPEEFEEREKLLDKINALGQELTDLINYDISITGISEGIYKKFCLNHSWLTKLTEEAKTLCDAERGSLEAAVADQSRIRDWIYFVITNTNSGISFKLRAIFSHFYLENFGLRKKNDKFSVLYDLYRFYGMDVAETEFAEDAESVESLEEEERRETVQKKRISYFGVQGSVFDHVMSDELALQDVNTVTANQMYNQDAKIRILLTDHLRYDFNKKFDEVRQVKAELLEAILTTNTTLSKIYSNINCMLQLLGREGFTPPELSVPEWQRDEFVKNLIEVDDSEIKAINRRKKKVEKEEKKRGRLLLWAIEFWVRALITMMDGVLEKLWEEEIKKEIPVPEFLSKKDPSEYTLEDQKILKDYEEKCRILEEDRKKYLAILRENESKTNELKTIYILKLNENVTELMILKLKYDFAIQHVRLRNFNTKAMYFKKLQWLDRIKMLRTDIDLLSAYIHKYNELFDFWTMSVEDLHEKVDNLTQKFRGVERHFRNNYLKSIPQHLVPDINKAFKKRPKISGKLLNSPVICKELSIRVTAKSLPKFPFPLPQEVFEYLDSLHSMDDLSNMPAAMEAKHWDMFVKLRRQKLEAELKLKAANIHLHDGIIDVNIFHRELNNLKSMKMEEIRRLHEAQEEYLRSVQDQTLELRLTMGQVELSALSSSESLKNSVLMHQDDVNDINALILKAGDMKIKAMQKVAVFRRQIIFKEWEHKMISTHIQYLHNMIYVIEKCKVSIEFLDILRNWKKVKAQKHKMLNSVGLLEKVSEEKSVGYRKQLARINEKISLTRAQIDEMKLSNKRISRQINNLKMTLTFSETNRDYMIEEKRKREQNEKMVKIKRHNNLIEAVRRDYVHIMELKTILELQRLRTYPTLGPNPDQCST